MKSYKKVFYIISTIFRMVAGSNLRFDDFQIFESIREYFLQIIFLLIFVPQDVKNIIHIYICRICLLQILFIFVFVHQKNYSLHSGEGVLKIFSQRISYLGNDLVKGIFF